MNKEGGYLEVKELYMGNDIINSSNYLDMDNNRDRSKHNCYFLGGLPL